MRWSLQLCWFHVFAQHRLLISSRIACPSETFAGQMPFGVGTSGVPSQRCPCWPCLPPRSRSCSIGTEPQRRGPICWFCMALVWTGAIKVSFAPASGHTCQMLREFASLCDLRAGNTHSANHRQLRAPSLSGRSAPMLEEAPMGPIRHDLRRWPSGPRQRMDVWFCGVGTTAERRNAS
jgi:hypothetical protein